jgi:hypothetical protein
VPLRHCRPKIDKTKSGSIKCDHVKNVSTKRGRCLGRNIKHIVCDVIPIVRAQEGREALGGRPSQLKMGN